MTFFRRFLNSCLVTLLLAVLPVLSAQANKPAAPLTVEDVVQLNKEGFSEEVIITKIRKNGKAFDLSTEELVELRRIGLGDSVIKFLLDPSQPYVPPQPVAAPGGTRSDPALAAPSQPAKQYPPDPHAAKVPAEPGLYRFPGEGPSKIDVKLLLGSEGKGGLLKKGKVVAYIIGPTAKTNIRESTPAFFLRLAEGKAIEEIILIALDRKGDRRELEMGTSGKKQEFKAEAVRQFDSVEIGPQLFKLTPTKLSKGEYLFLQIGSAEPPKGSYGKGFDFGIEEPAAVSKTK